VQAAEAGNRHDIAVTRCGDGTRYRRIFVGRQVSARLEGLVDARGQRAAQSTPVRDDDVIETFAANGADQPIGERIRSR